MKQMVVSGERSNEHSLVAHTKVSAFVKMIAAFKIVPKVSCCIVAPTFNFGALNWISTSGCHFVGINSEFVSRSSSVGLNAIKHFEQIVTISISLENKKNCYYLVHFHFGWKLTHSWL